MSSERANTGRTGRRRSHYWYWVAAIPATLLLWLATLAWLTLASSWVPFELGTGAVHVSLIALGVPFVVLTAYFPIAVYRDAAYVNRTSGQWAPEPMRQALVAALGPVVLVLVGALSVALGFPPTWPVVGSFLVSVPFAVYYLQQRRRHVGTPDVPW